MHAIPWCNYRTTNGVVFSILVCFMCMLYVYAYVCWIGLWVHESWGKSKKKFSDFSTNNELPTLNNMKKNVIFQGSDKGYRSWLICVSAFKLIF